MRGGSSTSAPPTALLQAQISTTETVRADVLGQLDSIDSKIQQKELELHALISQQQLLRDQVANMDRALEIHRRSLTPILILPADILAYLFHLVIDEYVAISMEYLSLYRLGGHRAFAFNVAAVCRKWRHFALAMPSIWARIWLDLSKLTLYEPDPHLRVNRARVWNGYLSTCLTRSGTSPLYLFLTEVQHTASDDYDTTSYRAAMSQILGAAGRWRVCRMSTSQSLCDEGSNFVSNLQLRTPLLEHFWLHYPVGIYDTVSPRPTPCRFLPFAPRLRYLCIPLTLACHTFSSMTEVKELEFCGGGPDNSADWLGAFQLLERCPALERWTVGDVYNFNENGASNMLDPPSSKYALRHLTTLHLQDIVYDVLASWSDALSFPALQQLTLDDYSNIPGVHSVLNGIAADSHVATLIVRCEESFDDLDLSRLMAHFPELREIRLKAFTLYEGDFSQLLAKDSAGRRWRVCPDLRTFAMVDTYFYNEAVVTGFLDFVRARAASASDVPPGQDAPDSRFLESVDMGNIVGNETIPLWLPEAVRGILRGDTDLHIST
ncbi:hypothetical protein EXIGLDRAFT_724832 [Exidia glandulosa HHB12029]|uniref:F-box domain-containing protein n=1 Tax=Exidia glandulosa HHB12029 TaxID=1314781 RepID=A0A165ZX11_EXIGL|nr:hypothetical protein EXIGLDRAFT_724832 [Exidia glandulosa HHB12029]